MSSSWRPFSYVPGSQITLDGALLRPASFEESDLDLQSLLPQNTAAVQSLDSMYLFQTSSSQPGPSATLTANSDIDQDRPRKAARSSATSLPACSSCRTRKIKCQRNDGEAICVPCHRKGIVCSVLERKTYKSRSGPRIDAAKAQYGQVDASPVASSSRLSISDAPGSGNLSVYSSEGKLNAQILSAATIGSLTNEYFKTSLLPHPIMDWSKFRARLHKKNYQITQMPADVKSLLLAVLAMSARISNNPQLIGYTSSTDLQSATTAKRRAEASKSLLKMSLDLIRSENVYLEPSPESVAAHYLVQVQSLGDEGTQTRSEMSMQRLVMVGQVRDLHENPERLQTGVYQDTLEISVIIADILCAGRNEGQLHVSDTDLEFFLAGHTDLSFSAGVSMQFLRASLQPGQTPAVSAFWKKLIDDGRDMVRDVCSPKAHRRVFNVAAAYSYLQNYDDLSLYASNASAVFRPVIEDSEDAMSGYCYLSLGQVALADCLLHCHRAIAKWTQSQPEGLQGTLNQLLSTSTSRLWTAARYIVEHLRDLLKMSTNINSAATVMFLHSTISIWAEQLRLAPTREGYKAYSLRDKLADVTTLCQALDSLVASWPHLAFERQQTEAYRAALAQTLDASEMYNNVFFDV